MTDTVYQPQGKIQKKNYLNVFSMLLVMIINISLKFKLVCYSKCQNKVPVKIDVYKHKTLQCNNFSAT